MNILDGKIKFQGLDPTAPYSLGNAYYLAEMNCPECGELTEDDVKMEHGYHDGYNWEHPLCKKCGTALPDTKYDK